jgi:hypothetical protein
MVNVYEYGNVNPSDPNIIYITDLVKKESLMNSCMSVNSKLTPSDIRRNLDLAWGIVKRNFMKMDKKENKVSVGPPLVDHAPCSTCGSTQFIKTGVCFTCSNCASSSSCS